MFPPPRFAEYLPHARQSARLRHTVSDVAPSSRELNFVTEEETSLHGINN